MEDQLPSIKKSNLKNEVYARKSIQELFPTELLSKAIVKEINYTSSCVAINNGKWQIFTFKNCRRWLSFPASMLFTANDLNGDGYPDLVLGGNQFGFMPQFERLDASFGDVLINDGKGNFIWQDAKKPGCS